MFTSRGVTLSRRMAKLTTRGTMGPDGPKSETYEMPLGAVRIDEEGVRVVVIF